MIMKAKKINGWLAKDSELYSKMCGYRISRKRVIHLNVGLLVFLAAAVSVEQSPYAVALVCLIVLFC